MKDHFSIRGRVMELKIANLQPVLWIDRDLRARFPSSGNNRIMTVLYDYKEYNFETLSEDAKPASIVHPQRAGLTQLGKRFLFFYLTSLLPSNLFMICGIIVNSAESQRTVHKIARYLLCPNKQRRLF